MNNSKESPEIRFAVLIDGDNAQPSLVADVLRRVGRNNIRVAAVLWNWPPGAGLPFVSNGRPAS